MAKNDSTALDRFWIGDLPPQWAPHVDGWHVFADSDDFLLSDNPFGQRFYVVDLVQRGVPANDLIRLIRRKSTAGLLALSAAPHAGWVPALDAGADAAIDRGATVDHVLALIAAVQRCVERGQGAGPGVWKLDKSKARLMTPEGAAIRLSPGELTLLSILADAGGAVVPRVSLIEGLWGTSAEASDGALHAALYRLRKRVEKAGPALWPLQAVSGVGYEFRASLLPA